MSNQSKAMYMQQKSCVHDIHRATNCICYSIAICYRKLANAHLQNHENSLCCSSVFWQHSHALCDTVCCGTEGGHMVKQRAAKQQQIHGLGKKNLNC